VVFPTCSDVIAIVGDARVPGRLALRSQRSRVSEALSGRGGIFLSFSMIRQIMFHNENWLTLRSRGLLRNAFASWYMPERDQHPIVFR
jgi:hypothetical protein